MDWSPADPRGDSPVPGETGHFDHHEWLKEFAVQMYAWTKVMERRIEKLEEDR